MINWPKSLNSFENWYQSLDIVHKARGCWLAKEDSGFDNDNNHSNNNNKSNNNNNKIDDDNDDDADDNKHDEYEE